MVTIVACSSDDNKGLACYDCSLELLGTVIESEYCDNGDGTIEVTINGETETVDLEGTSYDDFISQVQTISTCTRS